MASKTLEQKIRDRMKVICGLSVLAVFVTSYLLYNHYAFGKSFCDINATISCDIVNKSPYAEVLGIPTAAFGLAYYLFMAVVSFLWIKGCDFRKCWKKFRPGLVLKWLFGLTFLGVLFSLYLTYVEFFVLRAVCLFCVTQQIIILIIFGLLYSIRLSIDLEKEKTKACEFC